MIKTIVVIVMTIVVIVMTIVVIFNCLFSHHHRGYHHFNTYVMK